ncbi:tetratricopeptide repeat protein [Alkalilimnicola sp. S0819]|uniref:tetratricopeptide repeat protein n=1 Tax=Alkalilimnicola sp. S0819 TaxID=2613922 RepID=UPI00126252A7|nr:tetratricopeptide repeat protein [Alkalilimnicola sp. S0819]KAB7623618.1 tetratricopeptide repeat protein [Alkalilimnicola sp. S0819]MPQ16742.1 tetratricopeptide repeat protein [Alkalilimnicola sp. S0819]
MKMRRSRSIVLLMLLGLLAACAGRAPAPERDERRPVPVEEPAPEEKGREWPRRGEAGEPDRAQTPAGALPPLPPAAQGLAARAEQAVAARDYDSAAARLERAMRIAPDHPVLWQNLAVVRYAEGNYDQAEQLAQKSNTLAGDARALQRQNWRLIEAARRLRGDTRGAEQAAARARALGDD